ncbi:hypothetical protein, partial [Bradyrhizobium sp. 30]|uniref:hypothetical protein n=1 Tax=Bradyrhizobium sp. 30 TaxID=2782669 RepID=UPI001FF99BB9
TNCCHGIGALLSGTLIKPPEPKMTRARSSPDAYHNNRHCACDQLSHKERITLERHYGKRQVLPFNIPNVKSTRFKFRNLTR